MNEGKNIFFNPVVIIAYILIFIVLTFPLILNFRRAFAGSPAGYGDLPWEIWLQWFVSDSIRGGNSFFFTELTSFPLGTNIFRDTGFFFIPLLATLVSLFLNQPPSYNVTVCLLVVFSAFAGYRLVLYLVGDRAAAFLGGFVFGFNSYAINELTYSRLPEALGGFLALYILFLLKLADDRKVQNALAAGILMFLTTMSSFTYGLFSLLFTTGFFIVKVCFRRRFDPLLLKRFILLFVIALVLAAPYVGLYIHRARLPFLAAQEAIAGPPDELLRQDAIRNSLSLDFPLREEGLFGVPKKISLLVLAISLFSFFLVGKKLKLWLVVGGSAYILALGPYLKVSGHLVTVGGRAVPLPGLLLYRFFPFFSRVEWNYRFLVFLMMSLAVASAYGCAALARRYDVSNAVRCLTVIIVITLVMVEMKIRNSAEIFPFPLMKAGVPEIYRRLAGEKGDFAILQYPFGNNRYAYYQTIHGKKMFDGQANLTQEYPEGYFEYIESNSLLSALLTLQFGRPLPLVRARRESLERLGRLGFRYIIVHEDENNSKAVDRANRILEGFTGVYLRYGDKCIVYRLPGSE